MTSLDWLARMEIGKMGSRKKNPGEYVVGYRHPPLNTRFTPGQSGNPSGKRRENKMEGDPILDVLQQKLVVTEGGKRKRLPAGLIIAKKLRTNALSGHLPTAKFLLERPRPVAEISDTNTEQYDLSKLSIEELRTLKKILVKASGVSAE